MMGLKLLTGKPKLYNRAWQSRGKHYFNSLFNLIKEVINYMTGIYKITNRQNGKIYIG